MRYRADRRTWLAVALAAVSLIQGGCAQPAPEAQPATAATGEDSFSALQGQIDALTAEVRAVVGAPGDINIVLTGNGTTARLLSISRKVKGVCKTPMSDCDNGVTWRLIGANRLLSTWKVRIVEKQVGASKTGCFPAPFEMTSAVVSVPSGPPATTCQTPGDIWQYDVILYDGENQPVGDPIDPLLLMYY